MSPGSDSATFSLHREAPRASTSFLLRQRACLAPVTHVGHSCQRALCVCHVSRAQTCLILKPMRGFSAKSEAREWGAAVGSVGRQAASQMGTVRPLRLRETDLDSLPPRRWPSRQWTLSGCLPVLDPHRAGSSSVTGPWHRRAERTPHLTYNCKSNNQAGEGAFPKNCTAGYLLNPRPALSSVTAPGLSLAVLVVTDSPQSPRGSCLPSEVVESRAAHWMDGQRSHWHLGRPLNSFPLSPGWMCLSLRPGRSPELYFRGSSQPHGHHAVN